MTYEEKVQHAIKLIQSIPQDGPIEVSYSGGKDSDVILELTKMAGIPYEAIYKNTTIDPPGTIAHAKEVGATIVQPQMTMFEIIKKHGWPSRWARFCCSILKEYKIHPRAIQGIRRSESARRAKRYKEPEVCRVYSKDEKVRVYFPILEWTNDDVARFIKERGIKCHPLYYDERGEFRVERRLGCIGCPMTNNNGKKDFKEYPKMLNLWIKAHDEYIKTHPHTKTEKKFDNNVYNAAFFRFFCNNMDEYERYVNGLFEESNIKPKEFLETYFNIKL